MGSFFATQTGEAVLFALFFFGGIGIGWGVYRYGFMGLTLPVPLPEQDLLRSTSYFKTAPLKPKAVGGWATFMLAISVLSIFLVAVAIIFVLRHRFEGNLKTLAEYLLPVTTAAIFVMVGAIYFGLIRAAVERRLSPEVKRLWDEPSDQLIFGAGAFSFLAFAAYGLHAGKLTGLSLLMALFLLPVILMVGRVEGRFFLLFFIQELFKVRNWNLLEGKKVVEKRRIARIKGWVDRFLSVIAVVMVVVGLVTLPLGFVEFFEYTAGSSKSLFSEYAWVARLNLGILVLVLSLGPLISLATKPFGFINVWLNQRLYEQIASAWDIKTMNRNVLAWDNVVRMPQPQRSEGFGEGIALAGGGILGLLALTLASRVAFTHGALPEGHIMQGVFESLQLLSLVSAVVLIASLVELWVRSMEAKTTWVFARESKRAGLDLINHSLFGLHWLRMRWMHRDWQERAPKKWALPDILYGINDHPDLVKSEQLAGLKRAVRQVLPPALKPVAWQQLCAFYYNTNQPEKGRKTLFKALKKHPKYPDLWAIAIKIHLEEGDLEKAREAYEKAIRYGKKFPQAYCNYGAYFADRGQWDKANAIFNEGLKHCPNDGTLLFNRALSYGKQGRDRLAERWFKKTVRRDPYTVDAWLILADLVRDRGDLKGAEKLYRKAIEYGPYNANAWQGLGEMVLRSGRLEEARRTFKKALEYDRKHAVAWNNLAVTERELENPEEAVEAFRHALECDPTLLESWESLGQLFGTYGMWAEAEATYRGALEHHGDNGLLHRNLALMVRQQGRREEALDLAKRAAELDPESEVITSYLAELQAGGGLLEGVTEELGHTPHDDTAEGWTTLGEQKFAEGLWGEAEQCFLKAIALDDENPQLHAILGDILNQQGRFGDAKVAYEKALELDPEHMGATINLGLALMQAGDVEGAERAFCAAVELNPRELSPWTYLTYLARETQNIEGALSYHQQALEHLPEAPELWYSYGYLLAQLQNFPASEQAFREGLKHAPEHVEMRVNLGDILFHMERPEESIAAFEEAIGQQPENVGAWLKKATVEMKSGDLQAADRSFRRAIELHPGWTEALFRLTLINTVLGNMAEAFHFAELTLESNPEMRGQMSQQPELEPLWPDPRWQVLLEKYCP